MPFLDPYTAVLDTRAAAHLLRRATFGPTQTEITQFTGLTAAQAVNNLVANAVATPPPPVEMDETATNPGQTFLDKPFNGDRSFQFGMFIKYW